MKSWGTQDPFITLKHIFGSDHQVATLTGEMEGK